MTTYYYFCYKTRSIDISSKQEINTYRNFVYKHKKKLYKKIYSSQVRGEIFFYIYTLYVQWHMLKCIYIQCI